MSRRRRALAGLSLLALSCLLGAGCSDAPAAPVSGANGSVADTSVAVTGSGGDRGEQPTDGSSPTPSGGSPGSTVKGATTTTVRGATTTAATTGPGATDPPEQPPPPVSGCVDAPVGPAVVVVSFDDDQLRYAGGVAPTCLRIHATQQLRVTNAAVFASAVAIGASSKSLSPGASWTTAVLGSAHAVGDVFQVRVDVLAATLLVQVLH